MANRISKDNYYLNIATEVTKRGTCLRRNIGAVIVKNDQIVSTGYAGAPRGTKNCVDLGFCPREQANIPSGERYELCRSVHAEMNAVIHASRYDTMGATLYLVGLPANTKDNEDTGAQSDGNLGDGTEPCRLCKRVLINAGIEKVITTGANKRIKIFHVSDWVLTEEIDYHIHNSAHEAEE